MHMESRGVALTAVVFGGWVFCLICLNMPVLHMHGQEPSALDIFVFIADPRWPVWLWS